MPMQVDNVILRDPPMQRSPLFVGLDLTPLLQPQQQPCPGAYFQPQSTGSMQGTSVLLSKMTQSCSSSAAYCSVMQSGSRCADILLLSYATTLGALLA